MDITTVAIKETAMRTLIGSLALTLTLTLAGAAAGEGAWVLWEKAGGVPQAPFHPRKTTTVSAHPSQAACLAAAKARTPTSADAAATQTDNPPGFTYFRPAFVNLSDGAHRMSEVMALECWPAGVTPQ